MKMMERRGINASYLIHTSTRITCDDSHLACSFLVLKAVEIALDVQLVFSLLIGEVGEVFDGLLLVPRSDLQT